MAKIKWGTIAAILILVLFFTMPFVPAHTALANGGITPVYVNVATGDDTYDGSSPVHTTGSIGPKKTIVWGFTAVSSGGTVYVAAGTYPGTLYFNKSFTLVGAGAPSTIIDAGGTGYVIQVDGILVTLSGLTMRNGNTGTNAGGLSLINGSTVTVNDCVIKNNTGSNGGGVGIGTHSTLYMNRCTISGNSTPDSGYGGGGIHNDHGAAFLTNCTISGNTASSGTTGYGGGILNWPDNAATTLTNCTVVNNSATGSPGQGGGFYNDSSCTMTFKNTIVANNTATVGGNNGYNRVGSTLTSQGYNLDSENSCGFNQPTDKINTNPLLGTLQDNGGATPTHALLSGSPAIDAGTSAGAPATDQRGVPRPQPPGGIYDIGAYELIRGPVVTSVSPNSGNQGQTLTNVIITGNYFTGATAVSFGSDITINSLTVNSDTQITTSITIAAGATPGVRDVSVAALGGTGILPNGFTVLQPTQSVNTATGTGVATFTTSAGIITGLTAANSTPCGDLPGAAFPHGFFSFNITNLTPGATALIAITLPSNMPVGTQYLKCINGHWVNCTSLLGHNDGDNVLTLTLMDGGLGDADGVANGTIVDPGGPVVIVAPAARQVSPRLPATLKPAQMSVQYLSVTPQQTTVNQPVTITTNVVNTGDQAGNLNVVLKINGQVEQTRMVSVGPQGTQPVKFTVTKAQPGTYTVDIGGQKGSFTILGASSTATSKSDNVVMIAILVFFVLVIIAVVAVFLVRRPA
jgi:hypothetical protein